MAGKEFFDKIISSSSIASSNNQRKPTIVYYKLDITKDFKNKLKKISNTLNIQTKNIYYSEGIFYNKYINVTSWLEQIKNSTLVITDSFHCVCFSIIFNKNFVCIKNKNRGESRLFSLLGSLGLTDRFITEDELDTCLENIQDIDYTKINTIIEEQRKNSLTFLINALSKTNAIR
ncbi:polysaccharide pyruvyl transferase family protein [Providencia hangzhouensis]|uniref:polysaccharide pyruvyl transferase family protein n=1 Tax=Providencia hangzhouensis TaxID=3031799 RepID=UPI0034DCDC23